MTAIKTAMKTAMQELEHLLKELLEDVKGHLRLINYIESFAKTYASSQINHLERLLIKSSAYRSTGQP
jgi:hypothetical protein